MNKLCIAFTLCFCLQVWAEPQAQQLVFNEQSKECFVFWPGDKSVSYSLIDASKWETASVDNTNNLKTSIGTCNVKNHRIADCCERFGFLLLSHEDSSKYIQERKNDLNEDAELSKMMAAVSNGNSKQVNEIKSEVEELLQLTQKNHKNLKENDTARINPQEFQETTEAEVASEAANKIDSSAQIKNEVKEGMTASKPFEIQSHWFLFIIIFMIFAVVLYRLYFVIKDSKSRASAIKMLLITTVVTIVAIIIIFRIIRL